MASPWGLTSRLTLFAGKRAQNPFSGVYSEIAHIRRFFGADGAVKEKSPPPATFRQRAVMAPSTAIGSPVTNEAASELSQAIASPISGGFA